MVEGGVAGDITSTDRNRTQGGDNLPGSHSAACICELCPVSERLYSVDLVFKCRSLGLGAEADLLTYL